MAANSFFGMVKLSRTSLGFLGLFLSALAMKGLRWFESERV
jgi:hypothetical protein